MIDPQIFQTISQFMTAVGVIAAASYYISAIRNNTRNQQMTLETRQAQLFMQIYNRYYEVDFQKNHFYISSLEWKDFNDYWEKYGPENNPEANAIIASVGGFYEGIGVLVKRNLIDPTLVEDLMYGNIITYWEKMGPIFKEIRKSLNWPEAMEWTEYLYEEIIKISCA